MVFECIMCKLGLFMDDCWMAILCGAMFLKNFNSQLFRGLVLYQVAAAAILAWCCIT